MVTKVEVWKKKKKKKREKQWKREPQAVLYFFYKLNRQKIFNASIKLWSMALNQSART